MTVTPEAPPPRRRERIRYLDAGKLLAARLASGLDQPQLAEAAGFSQSAISALERGRRGTTLEKVGKLAAALHVEPAKLMPDETLARAGLTGTGTAR
jgi:transcriptional regulator with XRE-family HTH domain